MKLGTNAKPDILLMTFGAIRKGRDLCSCLHTNEVRNSVPFAWHLATRVLNVQE